LASIVTRPGQERRILLADEQAGSRDVVRLVLARLGYRVDPVRTGSDALSRARAEPYALILLSSSLPDMALEELGPRMREAMVPDAAPPILIIEREGILGTDEAADLPVRARLARPIDIEQLLRSVHALVLTAGDERTGMEEPVIDADHLASFTDGDGALESEIAALYVSSAEVYLQRMAEALEANAPWERYAHALKGASSNLGAGRVAALAMTAEHASPSPEQLQALHQAVDEVKTFFGDRRA